MQSALCRCGRKECGRVLIAVRRIADGAWADTGRGVMTRHQLRRSSRSQSRCRFSAERRSVAVGKAAVRRVSSNPTEWIALAIPTRENPCSLKNRPDPRPCSPKSEDPPIRDPRQPPRRLDGESRFAGFGYPLGIHDPSTLSWLRLRFAVAPLTSARQHQASTGASFSPLGPDSPHHTR